LSIAINRVLVRQLDDIHAVVQISRQHASMQLLPP